MTVGIVGVRAISMAYEANKSHLVEGVRANVWLMQPACGASWKAYAPANDSCSHRRGGAVGVRAISMAREANKSHIVGGVRANVWLMQPTRGT